MEIYVSIKLEIMYFHHFVYFCVICHVFIHFSYFISDNYQFTIIHLKRNIFLWNEILSLGLLLSNRIVGNRNENVDFKFKTTLRS